MYVEMYTYLENRMSKRLEYCVEPILNSVDKLPYFVYIHQLHELANERYLYISLFILHVLGL